MLCSTKYFTNGWATVLQIKCEASKFIKFVEKLINSKVVLLRQNVKEIDKKYHILKLCNFFLLPLQLILIIEKIMDY